MTLARLVSLSMVMKSLESGGIVTRISCGAITLVKTLEGGMPSARAARRPWAGAKQGDEQTQSQAEGHRDHREHDRDSDAVDECRRRQSLEEDRRLEVHAKPSREWPALAVNAYLMTSSTTGSIWYF